MKIEAKSTLKWQILQHFCKANAKCTWAQIVTFITKDLRKLFSCIFGWRKQLCIDDFLVNQHSLQKDSRPFSHCLKMPRKGSKFDPRRTKPIFGSKRDLDWIKRGAKPLENDPIRSKYSSFLWLLFLLESFFYFNHLFFTLETSSTLFEDLFSRFSL